MEILNGWNGFSLNELILWKISSIKMEILNGWNGFSLNELILWKLSSIKMEILNDIAWRLNWIGLNSIQFN
jgi:hypothetical protein